jgi:hypothetical protein
MGFPIQDDIMHHPMAANLDGHEIDTNKNMVTRHLHDYSEDEKNGCQSCDRVVFRHDV